MSNDSLILFWLKWQLHKICRKFSTKEKRAKEFIFLLGWVKFVFDVSKVSLEIKVIRAFSVRRIPKQRSKYPLIEPIVETKTMSIFYYTCLSILLRRANNSYLVFPSFSHKNGPALPSFGVCRFNAILLKKWCISPCYENSIDVLMPLKSFL